MSKSRWKDGRLDLGRLGRLEVHGRDDVWYFDFDGWFYSEDVPTEAAAQRAAERWLRAALKQASKKLNDSTDKE